MIKIIIVILAIVLEGLVFAGESNLGKHYVIAESLNVRVEPNTKAPVVKILSKGTSVEVFELKNGWARVTNISQLSESESISLWVSAKFLLMTLPQPSQCKVLDVDISFSYSGECKNGLANGEGVAKGRDIYRGVFLDGEPHDFGVYEWGINSEWAGHIYEGEWINGARTGFGIYTNKDSLQERGLFYKGAYVVECNSRKECKKLVEKKGTAKEIYCKKQYQRDKKLQDHIINLSLPELHEKYPNDNLDELQTMKSLMPFMNLFGDASDLMYTKCMKE